MSSNATTTNGTNQWRFFTNHFEVLLYIGRHPDARLRTVAEAVGITERASHRILSQLAAAGYVTVSRVGRRNHYRVTSGTTLRHPTNADVPVQALIDVVSPLARDLRLDA